MRPMGGSEAVRRANAGLGAVPHAFARSCGTAAAKVASKFVRDPRTPAIEGSPLKSHTLSKISTSAQRPVRLRHSTGFMLAIEGLGMLGSSLAESATWRK
jgi:hypothetical protein